MPNVGDYIRHGFQNTLSDNDLNEASVDVTKKGGGGRTDKKSSQSICDAGRANKVKLIILLNTTHPFSMMNFY